MRLNIALLVGLLALVDNAFAQEGNYDESTRNAALANSDSLFAIGVDLYNSSKYTEAIPIFTEIDSIDNATLPKESFRRVHSAMWLASCYYQLGDTLRASEAFPYYNYAPVTED